MHVWQRFGPSPFQVNASAEAREKCRKQADREELARVRRRFAEDGAPDGRQRQGTWLERQIPPEAEEQQGETEQLYQGSSARILESSADPASASEPAEALQTALSLDELLTGMRSETLLSGGDPAEKVDPSLDDLLALVRAASEKTD